MNATQNPEPAQLLHGGPGAAWPEGPPAAERFSADAPRGWDWEGLRANGKLYMFCYFADRVVALRAVRLRRITPRRVPD